MKLKVGNYVHITRGTYDELVARGWASNVPDDIDGKQGRVTTVYSDVPEPHIGVTIEYYKEGAQEIGIPEDCLEQI